MPKLGGISGEVDVSPPHLCWTLNFFPPRGPVTKAVFLEQHRAAEPARLQGKVLPLPLSLLPWGLTPSCVACLKLYNCFPGQESLLESQQKMKLNELGDRLFLNRPPNTHTHTHPPPLQSSQPRGVLLKYLQPRHNLCGRQGGNK